MTPSDQTELRELFIRFDNAWTQAFNEVDPHGNDTNHYDGHKAVYRRSKEIQSGILQEAEQLIAVAGQRAAYDANRAVIEEQKKYLEDMILSDGKTVIKALPVGMMYACANHLAEPLEQSLRKEQE